MSGESSPGGPVTLEPPDPGVHPKPRPHLKHIEGLRALAALMVYVNHAYAQSWNPMRGRYPEFPLSVFSYTLVTGHFAVTVFIALSGFCLALPVISSGGVLRDGTVGFIYKRARRILPPYYAALALCLVLIYTIIGKPSGSLWDVPIAVDKTALISHLLLLQDFFGTGRINYVFWSIAAEWHIYFLFPPFLWIARRRGIPWATVLYLVIGYAISLAFHATRIGRANPHYVGIFALGVLAAFISNSEAAPFKRWRQYPHYSWLTAVSLILTLVFVGVNGLVVSKITNALYDAGIGAFAFFALIASSTAKDSKLTRFLSFSPFVKLGTFSYSFYLIHAPLLQIMWLYGTEPLGLSFSQTFAVLLSVGLAIVIGAAYTFFFVFERPFLSGAAKTRVS